MAAAAFGALMSVVYLQTGSLLNCIALHVAYNALMRVLDYVSAIFPDWFIGYDLFRPGAWWLHATVLAGCAALTLEYFWNLRRSRAWPLQMRGGTRMSGLGHIE